MVSDATIETFDALLDVGSAATLAGLSLVTFAFLIARVQQLEQEAGVIRVKRGGADAYSKALTADIRRMRLGARMVVVSTVILLVSALLMLTLFDTFLETDLAAGGDRTVAVLDVALTGGTFLFGIAGLLVATLALGWDWLRR